MKHKIMLLSKQSDRLSAILCMRLQFRAVETCKFLVGYGYYTSKTQFNQKSARMLVVQKNIWLTFPY